jgi:hypothetical protein
VADPIPIELGGVCWWLARGADSESTRELIRSALQALWSGAARNLKTGRRKQLYPLDLQGGSPDHLLKVNDYGSLAGLRWALRGSKARHELEMAERVAARGIPTPVPLAAGERRSRGRLRTCYLLMPVLEGCVDLRRLWTEETLSPRERHALTTALGALSRRVHDAGIFQEDFAPNNFLARWSPSPELFIIDFERARLRTGNDEAARCFMLAKIDREFAGAPLSDRMRFLHAYSNGDPAEARHWWRRVRDYTPILARRDVARITRTVTQEGRRYHPLAHGAWRGYARKGIDDARLRDALPEERPRAGAVYIQALEDFWRIHYSGVRRSEGRRIWAMANFLWSRGGLCPRPLGTWSRGDQTILFLEQRPGAQPLGQCADDRRAHAAVRILLNRIRALAEIREPPLSESLLLEPQDGLAPRASLTAPHGVLPLGRRAARATRPARGVFGRRGDNES